MTDDTTPAEEASAPAEHDDSGTQKPREAPNEVVEQPDEDGDPRNREAAKWRRKLRDAEAERDTLQSAVAELKRERLEGAILAHMQDARPVWALGLSPEDLLDPEGRPDLEKVRQACLRASDELGVPTRLRGNVLPKVGNPDMTRGGNSFASAFAPPRGSES